MTTLTDGGIRSALAPLLSEKCILLAEHHAKALIARVADVARRGPSASQPEARVPVKVTASDDYAFTRLGGGIACIEICGVLTKYASWYDEMCGFVATTDLMEQLADSLDDPTITAIVLDIDSPGGFVNGTVELADAVALANAVKPVTAIVRGLCDSGAYWVASQCSQIISRPEAEVGNIGVYSVLVDVSKAWEDLGVGLTLVTSGQFKGMGADGKVTDDLVSDTRRIIMGLYQQFVAAVAKGRKLDPARALEIADGRAWLGKEAKQMGLIDQIASSFDAAIEAVTGASAARSAAPNSEENAMSKSNGAATPPNASAPAPAASGAGGAQVGDAKKIKTTLSDTIESAAKHRDQARKMLDESSSYTDGLADDAMDLAKQCVTNLESCAAESRRAAKALSALTESDDEDDTDDGDDGDDGDKKKKEDGGDDDAEDKKSKGKPAAASQLVAAFPEEKAFCMDQLTAGASLTAAHTAYGKLLGDRLKAAGAENQKLKKQLAIAQGGQEAIGVDATRDPNGDPAAALAAAGTDPEARAKAEWKANTDHCQEKFISEPVYVNVRKRELAQA